MSVTAATIQTTLQYFDNIWQNSLITKFHKNLSNCNTHRDKTRHSDSAGSHSGDAEHSVPLGSEQRHWVIDSPCSMERVAGFSPACKAAGV
jgi:hypothetical protein